MHQRTNGVGTLLGCISARIWSVPFFGAAGDSDRRPPRTCRRPPRPRRVFRERKPPDAPSSRRAEASARSPPEPSSGFDGVIDCWWTRHPPQARQRLCRPNSPPRCWCRRFPAVCRPQASALVALMALPPSAAPRRREPPQGRLCGRSSARSERRRFAALVAMPAGAPVSVARPRPRLKETTAPGKPAPCVSRASPDPGYRPSTRHTVRPRRGPGAGGTRRQPSPARPDVAGYGISPRSRGRLPEPCHCIEYTADRVDSYVGHVPLFRGIPPPAGVSRYPPPACAGWWSRRSPCPRTRKRLTLACAGSIRRLRVLAWPVGRLPPPGRGRSVGQRHEVVAGSPPGLRGAAPSCGRAGGLSVPVRRALRFQQGWSGWFPTKSR